MSLPHSTQVTTKTVTPFKLDDLNGIDWLPDGAYMDLSSILARSTIWTGRVNGHVVAICGLTKLNGHTAEAWTYLHREALLYPYWLHRATKRILHNFAGAYDMLRVQAMAVDQADAACRWLEHLGFAVECLCPLMGHHGETMRRYVWFPKGERWPIQFPH